MVVPPDCVLGRFVADNVDSSIPCLHAFPCDGNILSPYFSHLRTLQHIFFSTSLEDMTEAEVAHTQHGDGVTVLPTFGSETSQTRKRSKKSGLKMMFISGVGFLADAYDLFVIDFVVAILSSTASVEPKSGERGLVTAAALAGAVIGQLGELRLLSYALCVFQSRPFTLLLNISVLQDLDLLLISLEDV